MGACNFYVDVADGPRKGRYHFQTAPEAKQFANQVKPFCTALSVHTSQPFLFVDRRAQRKKADHANAWNFLIPVAGLVSCAVGIGVTIAFLA